MKLPILTVTTIAALALSVSARAENTEINIKGAGGDALALEVPKDAQVKTKGEKTSIVGHGFQICIWPVAGAKTVAAAVPQAPEIIKSEFLHLAVKSTESIKVAGHDAKLLKGSGEEADDNDPGAADVVLFTDGKAVFAACVHGERDEAEKQRPEMIKVLGTIKAKSK